MYKDILTKVGDAEFAIEQEGAQVVEQAEQIEEAGKKLEDSIRNRPTDKAGAIKDLLSLTAKAGFVYAKHKQAQIGQEKLDEGIAKVRSKFKDIRNMSQEDLLKATTPEALAAMENDFKASIDGLEAGVYDKALKAWKGQAGKILTNVEKESLARIAYDHKVREAEAVEVAKALGSEGKIANGDTYAAKLIYLKGALAKKKLVDKFNNANIDAFISQAVDKFDAASLHKLRKDRPKTKVAATAAINTIKKNIPEERDKILDGMKDTTDLAKLIRMSFTAGDQKLETLTIDVNKYAALASTGEADGVAKGAFVRKLMAHGLGKDTAENTLANLDKMAHEQGRDLFKLATARDLQTTLNKEQREAAGLPPTDKTQTVQGVAIMSEALTTGDMTKLQNWMGSVSQHNDEDAERVKNHLINTMFSSSKKGTPEYNMALLANLSFNETGTIDSRRIAMAARNLNDLPELPDTMNTDNLSGDAADFLNQRRGKAQSRAIEGAFLLAAAEAHHRKDFKAGDEKFTLKITESAKKIIHQWGDAEDRIIGRYPIGVNAAMAEARGGQWLRKVYDFQNFVQSPESLPDLPGLSDQSKDLALSILDNGGSIELFENKEGRIEIHTFSETGIPGIIHRETGEPYTFTPEEAAHIVLPTKTVGYRNVNPDVVRRFNTIQ